MRIVNRTLIFTFFLWWGFGHKLSAQVQIHQNLNIEDGLVYSQVLFIHEDQQGYMWFGTSSGISKWDGLTFRNFILPEGLIDNNCKWIAEFPDGTLFFATRKGIVQYSNEHFSAIPDLPPELNQRINGLFVVEGKLYIAAAFSGLWIYDGQSFTNINSDIGLISNNIQALAKGSAQRIYLAISADQIYTYQDEQLNRLNLSGIHPGVEVNTLFEDKNGALWIGTQGHGIYIQNQDEIVKIGIAQGLSGTNINHFIEAENNRVLAATDNGISIIEKYAVQSVLTEKNGLSNNFTWMITQDRNGIYYIGTDGGGVDIYRPGLFQTINAECGLPDNTVWTICETYDGNMYFGTDHGLAYYNQQEAKVVNPYPRLTDHMILCLHEARDRKIYAGTNENGVAVLEKGEINNINAKQGLDGPSVWTITEDKQGKIYFGTYDGGINVWDGRNIIDTINVEDGLPTNAIVSSFCSADGSLYFGTDGGGVVRIKEGEIDTVLLQNNTVWSIYEDDKQNLYFGTNDRGLIYFRSGKWDRVSIGDGLSHNSILGILEDAQGRLYLSADNGLNVIEFNKEDFNIRIIGRRDGLASNECNQGAYFKDRNGALWFGTVKGVSRYDPELSRPNTNPPQLHLTRIQLFDQDIVSSSFPGDHSFKYNENYFKFEFTGIDLSAPHKVQYKYRLSGVDQDWLWTDHPHVQYTNLDQDDYVFEVMAGNEWDAWSRPVQFRFSISPPFWERWWFIFFAFIIIVSPAIVLTRQRIQRVLALERLRSKIAADLHDDIGSGLSEINILSAVAVAKAPAEAKPVIETELNKIGNTARSLIEGMSDIVWLVNPQKDAVSDLVSRLKDSFSDLFEAKNILFRTDNAEALQKVRLKMEYRQHLFMILKEAIHNAIKYSEATEIKMSVKFTGRLLLIQLTDNGKGFDMDRTNSGNGLTNMKTRAEKIKGRLEIHSEQNKGTTIRFEGKV